MLSTTSQQDRETFFRRLSFPPAIEAAFQADYYFRLRSKIRFGLYALTGLNLLFLLLPFFYSVGSWRGGQEDAATFGRVLLDSLFLLIGAALNVLLLVASRRSNFSKYWQPAIVGMTLVSFLAALLHLSPKSEPFGLFFILLVASRFQRLQFRWVALEFVAAALLASLSGLGMFVRNPASASEIAESLFQLLVMATIFLVFNYRGEKKERREWWELALAEEEKHELERREREHLENLVRERNEERQKREQSDRMLHILSQAIGGIVHDLGNPLTTVQSGAETLLMFVKAGDSEPEMVQEFAEMISDGAKMLNYLRLSLMEQTRVLEGKPVPVELKPTSLSHMIKAGAQFQKPKFSAGRKVTLEGDDFQVCVDELRFITVFMNLIGNALKYSDGEVCISWRIHEDRVLIAVQDQGRAGQGISREQAERLFVAFGRLDTHAQIEGTGLGLLSVRKIAEAHDGEVYIEGQSDGAAFSTAIGTYPTMLQPGFATAFVTACLVPFEPPAPPRKSEEAPMFQQATADERLVLTP